MKHRGAVMMHLLPDQHTQLWRGLHRDKFDDVSVLDNFVGILRKLWLFKHAVTLALVLTVNDCYVGLRSQILSHDYKEVNVATISENLRVQYLPCKKFDTKDQVFGIKILVEFEF